MSVESPIRKSHNFFCGEDRPLNFTVRTAAGAAVDISGWAFEFVLRASEEATAALLTKTTGAGITITNGPAGLLTVTLEDTDTLLQTPGTLAYALRRTDAGFENVVAFGPFVLQRAASR